MLRDDVWQKIAAPNEMLCGKCTLDRSVAKLGRVTTFADLLPCPFNLFHQPVSWFDVFTHLEGPPQNLAEWRAAGASMTAEQWRAIRKETGLKIDPETAEVTWQYGSGLDPYGLHDLSGEKNDYVRRNCFARAPRSDVWILFGDLPEQVREALWEKHRSHLAAYPTALVPIEVARWPRDADVATIARCILGTSLRVAREQYGSQIADLKRALVESEEACEQLETELRDLRSGLTNLLAEGR
jgi:hypothetical protein